MKLNESLVKQLLAPLFVALVAWCTYVHNYDQPQKVIWDETYHVSGAYRYLTNTFWQEYHPPWGKMVIAAGEKILQANAPIRNEANKIANFSKIQKDPPKGFSFRGLRLFPVFFAWMSAVLIYLLLYQLTSSLLLSMGLSFLYMFDNAIIVHSRAAMLDPTLHFGFLAVLNLVYYMYRQRSVSFGAAATMGLMIGWCAWSKTSGPIALVFIPMLFLIGQGNWRERLRRVTLPAAAACMSFLAFSVFVWKLHCELSTVPVSSLPNKGWYDASPELKAIKVNPTAHTNPFRNFYVEVRDYYGHFNKVHGHLPKLDPYKRGENGSMFYLWPFGAKPISFRWEKLANYGDTKYLYMVANPFGWFVAFAAVLLTLAYFISRMVFGLKSLDPELDKKMFPLFLVYGIYMFIMSGMDRIAYMYHYFLPLLLSFFLLGLWANHFIDRFKNFSFRVRTQVAYVVVLVFIVGSTRSYAHFRPLTYYSAINCEEFNKMRVFDGWELRSGTCDGPPPNVAQKGRPGPQRQVAGRPIPGKPVFQPPGPGTQFGRFAPTSRMGVAQARPPGRPAPMNARPAPANGCAPEAAGKPGPQRQLASAPQFKGSAPAGGKCGTGPSPSLKKAVPDIKAKYKDLLVPKPLFPKK